MFDLAFQHIAALTDEHLRTLVGMLCERQLGAAGLPESAVTYGGDQRAPDGGVDARVSLPSGTAMPAWVPRPGTVFQVKQEKAGRRAAGIAAEMCPKGVPRPIFAELAAEGGAYVLVSGKENLAEPALRERRSAMRQALAGVAGAEAIALDFYDGHQMARWANLHPGVVLWVRERIGEPLSGWRPFDDWSANPQQPDSEYLLDDQGRLIDGTAGGTEGLPVAAGLERMRAALTRPGAAVRLVGLSGMGKTRLVQALFDRRVGTGALDPALAVYADVGADPNPSPQSLLARLARDGRRAVMIVDNCLPALHTALARDLGSTGGAISLITVEYDVGDDDHEGTEVFRLEPASEHVIDGVIARAHPHITGPDRRSIVGLCEGNARLALALAATVQRGDSVARLSRSDLFNRLFHQRHDRDQALLRAAEACALVYSFDVTADGPELPLLTELAGQTAADLHRHVAELVRRQLAQKRDRWRAVLPQALAIHLARAALENIPSGMVRRVMEERAGIRLQTSFTRRIRYLHDSEEARSIVAAWLAPGGLLGDVAQLSPHGWAMFENVAPVEPEQALRAIQTTADARGDALFFSANHHRRIELVGLLHSLAYEPEMFDRAAWLMVRALATEAPDNRNNSGRRHVEELFSPYLSGTHASQTQRLALIDRLLEHPEAQFNEIGGVALKAMLNAGRFTSFNRFEFGARPRDFGWQPRTQEERTAWYRTALTRIVALASPESRHSCEARALLAKQFHSLAWRVPSLVGDLKAATITIGEWEFWPEGWKAVCAAIAFRGENPPAETLAALRDIERQLRPAGLVQMTHAYVLSDGHGVGDLLDTETMEDLEDFEGASERLAGKIQALGHALALEEDTLDRLLPKLVAAEDGHCHALGRSLGEATSDLDALWTRLTAAFAETPNEQRNAAILRGYLSAAAKRDPGWLEGILEGAVLDPLYGPWFPLLQTAVRIDDAGVRRLHLALDAGLARAGAYRQLAFGHAEDLPDETLAPLIDAVARLPDGGKVALGILSSRSPKTAFAPALAASGRAVILASSLAPHNSTRGYRLSRIVERCFTGSDAEEDARRFCRTIVREVNASRAFMSNIERTLRSLAALQPLAFRDVFLGEAADSEIMTAFRYSTLHHPHPLLAVSTETLLTWAGGDPLDRFPRLARALGMFPRDAGSDATGDDDLLPLAVALIDHSPDKAAVLTAFGESLVPNFWAGPRSEVLEERRQRLKALVSHPDVTVRAWVTAARQELAGLAERERAEEEGTGDRRAQSFE